MAVSDIVTNRRTVLNSEHKRLRAAIIGLGLRVSVM